MSEKNWSLHLLTKVLDDLDDFLPYLVLVGGWVPYLYSRYLWEGVKHEPLSTVDIDFGFQNIPYKKAESIADRVRKKNYGEHHISMDRPIPFVPVVRIDKENVKADVEFITSPSTSEEVKLSLVGREIKINEIKDFDILLKSPITANIEGRKIAIPEPSIFTFHKLLTFIERERTDKQQKDLYYAYYVLFFDPDNKRLTKEISELINGSKQGSRVKENIKLCFTDIYAKGPSLIADCTKGSAIRTLVSDIRQDAYDRIAALIH